MRKRGRFSGDIMKRVDVALKVRLALTLQESEGIASLTFTACLE
jgi:hypothetical protein